MRYPNSFGSVIKLSGRRRKKYAVRISAGYKQRVCIPNKAELLHLVDKYPFKYRKAKNDYAIYDDNDAVKTKLDGAGVPYRIEFVRRFRYLAYFSKSSDAHQYLAQMNRGDAVAEHVSRTQEPTFDAVYRMYIDFISSMKKKPTQTRLDSYTQGFNLWSDLHTLKFHTVTTQQLQDCLSAHSNLSKASVGRMVTIIRNMYKYALAHDICTEDRSQYLFMEYTQPDTQKHKPFTKDEIEVLWKSDDPIAKVALILIYTGMRASEFLQMRTENIHLDDRYMVGGMKTDAGKNRYIPIHKKIMPLVQYFYDPKREYLYVNGAGNPMRISHFNDQRWKPFFEKIDMAHLTHDCRHTFATMTEKAGISEFHRKLIIGHKIQDLTNGRYTHVAVEDLISDIDKIP